MALRLYLDDCAYSHRLADLLRQAGHTVIIPAQVGLSSAPDRQHFNCAATNGYILVTKNPSDFLALHEEDRNHHGIIGIRQDNDITRDMTYQDIVQAIGNLEQVYATSGLPLAGAYFELNQWRFAPPAPSPATPPPSSASAPSPAAGVSPPPTQPPTSQPSTTTPPKSTGKKGRKGRKGQTGG